MTSSRTPFRRFLDLTISAVLYTYFVVSFFLPFCWIYLFFHLFSRNREVRFQKTTHLFYRGFFFLVRIIMPWVKIRIGDDVRSIRSSVIVSNHLSYLDPILLISLYARHKTIVKNTFFHYPFFSWVLTGSNYVPSSASGEEASMVIRNLETMQDFLASGGNLFVFPEGTRSRDGTLGAFNKGAFTIARKCQAPIQVLRIRNTHRLFPPGGLLWNAGDKITVTVDQIGTLSAESIRQSGSLSEIIQTARSMYTAEGCGAPEKP
jgi:1-acyl-sn-glycerol-3-phosphate acyltransferase